MFDLSIILYEYTEILLGKRKNYSDNFFDAEPEENEKNAVKFIRTVTRTFLRCRTLEAARNTITPEIIMEMKLDTIMPYIRRPRFVHQDDKDIYVIARIYTEHFNVERWMANYLCEKIRAGELTKFPKYYMDENMGRRRSRYCLKYFLSLDVPYMRIPDLYRMSTTPQFTALLRERVLLNVRLKLYSTPVDYLHRTLEPELRDDALYHMYSVLYQNAISTLSMSNED